jgi:delta14-sterol reductase
MPMIAALGLLLFLAALFAAVKYLPGAVVLGREESDGTRFPYRINGLAVFAAVNVAVAAGTLIFDLSLAPLIHHFWALFGAANAVSFALAFWLHLRAGPGPTRFRQKLIGRELNPRVFGVDLKMWAYEPSLLGLGLLIAAFGYEQYERHGQITPQMGFWLVGWWIYLATTTPSRTSCSRSST